MYGFNCCKCGHQETVHSGEIDIEEEIGREQALRPQEGYSQALCHLEGGLLVIDCEFEYSPEDLQEVRQIHAQETGNELGEGEYPSPIHNRRDDDCDDKDDWGGGL